jgi:protease IV
MSRLKTIILVIVILWIIAFIAAKLLGTFIPERIVTDGIAIIPIHGEISIEGSSITPFIAQGASSTRIVEDIKKANENSGIKAIILDINSPGGAVVASREIATAVKSSDKPIIALIREVGASGAYWIASASDKVVADELSITGSVGVIASYVEFAKFLERYDLKYQRLVAGELKDTASPFKELTPQERILFQKKLDLIHEVFLEDVTRNRNLAPEQVAEIRKGTFYLGREALDLNLVDSLGNKDTAINLAKELAGIKDGSVVEYKEKKSVFDLFRETFSSLFYYMGRGIGTELGLQQNLEILAE